MVQGRGSRESLYTVYAGLQSYYEILSRVYRVRALGLRASASRAVGIARSWYEFPAKDLEHA